MRKVLVAVVLLLLCSSVALAGTSIRGGVMQGEYEFGFGPLSMFSNGLGGYVAATSYLSDFPAGVTASYSMFKAGTYKIVGDITPTATTTEYEGENTASLLKAFAGYSLPGFGVTVGGGWVILNQRNNYEETSGNTETLQHSGPALAAFTSLTLSPQLELSAEGFYAPQSSGEMVVEANSDPLPSTGYGIEASVAYALMQQLRLEAGYRTSKFTFTDSNGSVFNSYSGFFGGVKLVF